MKKLVVLALALLAGCEERPPPPSAPDLDAAWADYEACIVGEPLHEGETYLDRFGWNGVDATWYTRCSPYYQRARDAVYRASRERADPRLRELADAIRTVRGGSSDSGALADPTRVFALAADLGIGTSASPSSGVPRPIPPPDPAPLVRRRMPVFARGRVERIERGEPARLWVEGQVCTLEGGSIDCAPAEGPPEEAPLRCRTSDGPIVLSATEDGGALAIEVDRGGRIERATLPLRHRYGADSRDCIDGGVAWTQVTGYRPARAPTRGPSPTRVQLDQAECTSEGCVRSNRTIPLVLASYSSDLAGRAAVSRLGAATVLFHVGDSGEVRARIGAFDQLGEASDVVLTNPGWRGAHGSGADLGRLTIAGAFQHDGGAYVIVADRLHALTLVRLDESGAFRAIGPSAD